MVLKYILENLNRRAYMQGGKNKKKLPKGNFDNIEKFLFIFTIYFEKIILAKKTNFLFLTQKNQFLIKKIMFLIQNVLSLII